MIEIKVLIAIREPSPLPDFLPITLWEEKIVAIDEEEIARVLEKIKGEGYSNDMAKDNK